MKPADLQANPKNWRKHPTHQQKAMQGILDEVGWVAQIIWNKQTGHLIDGHLRVEMALRNKETSVPVNVVDLTPEEEILILSTFDPIGAMAETDKAMLEELMKSIESEEEAINQMIATIAKEERIDIGGDLVEAPKPQIDQAAELQTKWGTARGQLWQCGDHRVLCGDSTNAGDVARLMGGEKVIACITSPPYAAQREYRGVAEWDTLVPPVIANAHGVTAQDGHLLVNLGLVHTDGKVFEYWRPLIDTMADLRPLYGWYVWDKLNAVPGDSKGRLAMCHEWIFHFATSPRTVNKTKECKMAGKYHGKTGQRAKEGHIKEWHGQDRPCQDFKVADSVIRATYAHSAGIDHPAQYSEAFVSEMIEPFTMPGESILDPFLGSGTTMIACEQLGRRCFGIEISPAYVAVILQRFYDMTGKAPVLLEEVPA